MKEEKKRHRMRDSLRKRKKLNLREEKEDMKLRTKKMEEKKMGNSVMR